MIVRGTPLLPRLESHYKRELYGDMMTLLYSSAISQQVETTSVNQLYKQPLDTSTRTVKKKSRARFINLIDYTAVPKTLNQNETSLSPSTGLPSLNSVSLSITMDQACSRQVLFSALASLYCISGCRGTPIFALEGDAKKKIRKGMAIGAQVKLSCHDGYHFIDKMVQCVLPRIREWNPLNPVGDGNGSIAFTLPAASIGTFPDIEPHFDSIPRLFDTKVTITTTAQNDLATCLLLSGFQLLFLPSKMIEVEKKEEIDDPWAAMKAAKTREERQRLFKLLQAKKG